MRYEIEQGRRDSLDKYSYIYNGEGGSTFNQSVYIHEQACFHRRI